MDISAALLHKLLLNQDIETFSKLKLNYLDPTYSPLYAVIATHYARYNKIPSFDDLEVTLRDSHISNTLAAVKLLEIPDVDTDVVFDALLDVYTQNETIKLLEPFIDRLTQYTTEEVKENLATMALQLEKQTTSSENVYNMQDLMLFQQQEEIDNNSVALGINHSFDSETGGLRRQELMLIGGKRGAGKSIVSSNIFVNQYLAGNTSIYFSIEMSATEINERHASIISGVPLKHIKLNTLSVEDELSLVRIRADMFSDADAAVGEFLVHKDRFKFEIDLVGNYEIKEDNQMIIIDNRDLTIGAIDLHIGKVKSAVGDKLFVVVVDYINQIRVENASPFDWIAQVELSRNLKNLARKYNVAIITPYQIDDAGLARFSRGILDAADMALIIDAGLDSISFNSTKMRGNAAVNFTSPVDFNTVTISPQSIDSPTKKPKKTNKENANDLSWNT